MAVIRRSTTTPSSYPLHVTVELTSQPSVSGRNLQVDRSGDMRRNVPSGRHERIFGHIEATTETLEDALEAWEKVMRVSSDIGRYFLKSRIISARKKRKLQESAGTETEEDDGEVSQTKDTDTETSRKVRRSMPHQLDKESNSMEAAVEANGTTETSAFQDNTRASTVDDPNEPEDVREICAMASLIVRLKRSQKRFSDDIRRVMLSVPSSSSAMLMPCQTEVAREHQAQSTRE